MGRGHPAHGQGRTRRQPGITDQGILAQVGGGKARTDQHDIHPRTLDLVPQRLEQTVQRVLAGVVGAAIQQRRKTRQRAEYDDLPVSGNQAGQRCLGAVQRAEIVDRHDPLKHLQIGVGKGAAVADAGIVDQHIDATKTLCGQRHGFLHRRCIGHVAAQAHGLHMVMISEVLQQTIQLILLQIENHQPRASLSKTQHQRPADTGTAAGDQHHLALINLAGKNLAMHAQPPRSKRQITQALLPFRSRIAPATTPHPPSIASRRRGCGARHSNGSAT